MNKKYYQGTIHDIRTSTTDMDTGLQQILNGFKLLHSKDILIRITAYNMVDYWDIQVSYCTRDEWVSYGMEA